MNDTAQPETVQFVRRLLWLGGAVFLLVMLLRPLPSLYVDYLWFQMLGFENVFLTRLSTQAILSLLFGLFFFVVFTVNALIALRPGPANLFVVPEMQAIVSALEQIRPRLRQGVFLVGFLLAVPASQWGIANWLTWLEYRNQSLFGLSDPIFGLDYAFYVFSIPLIQSVLGFLTFTLFVSSVAAIIAYFVQGRFRIRPGFISLARDSRIHVLILLAVALLFLGLNDLLARFELLRGGRGIVSGAGYADIKAGLPGLTIAAIASGLGVLLVLTDIFRRSLRLTLITLVAVAFVHLGFVELWPAAIQRFIVAPSELDRERPYIEHEIAGTRFGFGLNDVQERGFSATENLTGQQVAANSATVNNLRLWETGPLKSTNQQLQEIRTYYDFVDVDQDRYVISGNLRQVALSPRELNPAALPSRTWINEHLTYTHGYGLAVATVNEISPEGLPVYLVQDIPPQSKVKELEITRPEIYYGELGSDYVFVNSRALEFDYPSGEENVYAEYVGTGGVSVGDFFSRLLFSMHFVEGKIVLTNDLLPESKIMIHRRIQDRVNRIAPFLIWEGDPYMVVRDDGSLVWMLDGYTSTDRIPYSSPMGSVGNYIRNPVKAVVDAYHGSIDIYVVESGDPLIRTYASIFPGLFSTFEEMPEDIRRHMRYPVGLFAIQAQVYSVYHMTDPQVFYNKEDLWKVANRADGGRVEPYYIVTKLAGIGVKEEFILMLPFTPSRKENMIAWMCARNDQPDYGGLILFSFPKQRLIFGPTQVESRINQDTEISKELTLWNQQGSEVIRGNLLVIPIDSSLVYFQPLYLKASSERGLPELKRIVVSYGNRIAMEPTMSQALTRVFGPESVSQTIELASSPGTPQPVQPLSKTAKESLARAAEFYERANQALRRGDLQAYGREIEALGRVLEDALE